MHDFNQDPKVVEQERLALNARKRALDESINALERSYTLFMRKINLTEPLAAKGLMSEVKSCGCAVRPTKSGPGLCRVIISSAFRER